MTGTGKIFLDFDSGVGAIIRKFIFATNDGIGMVVNSSQWFGDGTVRLCPQVFFSNIYESCPVQS